MSVSKAGSGPKIQSTKESDKVQTPRADQAEKPAAKGKPAAKAKGDSYDKSTAAPKAESSVPGDPAKASGATDGKIQRAARKPGKGGVEMPDEAVTVGAKGKAEAKDPVERAMVETSARPPALPNEIVFGNGAVEIATAQMTTSWANSLGMGKPAKGTSEYKAAVELFQTGNAYTKAAKDYNDTVQIKGQAVLSEVDSAKKSGALKKMDDAFDGSPVMDTMQKYQKAGREAEVAYKALTGVATPEAKSASEAVGAAEEKLKQLQLGDLKGAAEKNKAALAEKIEKVKGLVDEGWNLGKALAESGLSASAGPLVEYAMKKIDDFKDSAKGAAEGAIKGKITEMLAGPEMKQMAEVEAQIQAYDTAMHDSKFKGANKELGAAKSALEAKMGGLEVARDNYVSKRTEQGEAVDQLKSLEDEYNKQNPGKKSHVFEKLQDYHSTVSDKAQTLAGASAAYQQMLEKPPFAGGHAKNPDAKAMMRQADELLSFYNKNYTGADKEQKISDATALYDYAKSMGDWAAKEGATAKGISAGLGHGDQYAVADAAVKDSLAGMGAKADKSKIEAPR